MTNFHTNAVLARKYRPKKFDELVGQKSLVNILSSSILNDKLAQAYLLTGIRGVGKTTSARLIAMSINCQERSTSNYEPCLKCKSCLSTKDESNLDVVEIDAASNTGVDDVREIIENVKYKPVITKYKIFIVDEVHMLSKSAFNALLKTLEEPPPHVKFIFATTEVKKIPITVLSRCQRFDLHRVDNKTLSEYLIKISKLENIKIDNNAIGLIVRASDGSVRDSLSLLDQATYNNEEISSNTIIDMLGLADRIKIFELLDYIFRGEAKEALNSYRKIYDLGADVIMIFEEMLETVHFLTKLKISPELKNDIYLPELERHQGDELSSKLSLNSLGVAWQILFKGYQELNNGTHLFQTGEMIIIRLLYFNNDLHPENLSKNLKKTSQNNQKLLDPENKENIEKNKIEDETKLKDKQKFYQNIDYEKQIDEFRKFVEQFYLKREGMYHAKLYNEVLLISFLSGEITMNVEKISDPNFVKDITKLVSKWTGRIWKIQPSSSNIGRTLFEDDLLNQQKEIENMKNNEQIKNILKNFENAKIHSITDVTKTNDKNDNLVIGNKKEN